MLRRPAVRTPAVPDWSGAGRQVRPLWWGWRSLTYDRRNGAVSAISGRLREVLAGSRRVIVLIRADEPHHAQAGRPSASPEEQPARYGVCLGAGSAHTGDG